MPTISWCPRRHAGARRAITDYRPIAASSACSFSVSRLDVKILVVAPLSPAGGASGGTLVTDDLARSLEQFGRVERTAVYTFGTRDVRDSAWSDAKSITLEALRRRGIARALALGEPLSSSRFVRRDLAASLATRGPVDVVVALTPAAWYYARRLNAARRVFVAFNVEAELYERAVARETSRLRRLVWQREARAMHRLEARVLREADSVICLGERDRQALAERYGVEAAAWYPGVPMAEPTRLRESTGRVVGMVGTMSWQPNRWGAEWFLTEVWPLVRARVPNARLLIGGAESEQLQGVDASGVEALGRVPDLTTFYERLDVVAAPVRGGGGLKIKVLDASARGLPVVTTPEGIEGMNVGVPPSIGVADDASSFANELVDRLCRVGATVPDQRAISWYRSLVAQGHATLRSAVTIASR